MRPGNQVMHPRQLGAFRVTPLSFSRSMLRKAARERWQVNCVRFDLDAQGHGEALYRIDTLDGCFHFLVLSQEMKEEERSDRVISERWDVTFALCEGEWSEEKLQRMRENLPKQEAGRGDFNDLVWSRANRSTRVFQYIVDCLASGTQPKPEMLAKSGYILRTTAFYGNGKFGVAPYEKMKGDHSFNGAFRAQMFAAYMVRAFSFHLVEHVAHENGGDQAVVLDRRLKRYLGIGNATGLGMVPFLIRRPQLVHQWIEMRERALARVKNIQPSLEQAWLLLRWLDRGIAYFQEYPIRDLKAFTDPDVLVRELSTVKAWIEEWQEEGKDGSWKDLTERAERELDVESVELLHTFLMETHVEAIVDLEDETSVEEADEWQPGMQLSELKRVMEEHYAWALRYDFSQPHERKHFWYRSVEKEEPRLGVRGKEKGEEYEMPLNVAEQVQELAKYLEKSPEKEIVASFVLRHPWSKSIIKRIQALRHQAYSEIQGNLLGENLLPVYLMRCKLSLFGAERFDPQSNRWVRVTLFQGAPLLDEIGRDTEDDWIFPLIPQLEEDEHDNNYD